MGKNHENTCPGCSRHCPLSHVRCGYGRKHIEKMKKQGGPLEHIQCADGGKHRHKWEKYVTPNGLIWQLLSNSSRIKRTLRKKAVSEQQILSALEPAERAQFLILLGKITETLD